MLVDDVKEKRCWGNEWEDMCLGLPTVEGPLTRRAGKEERKELGRGWRKEQSGKDNLPAHR